MKNASELLKAYLDNVQDARVAAGLFAADGAIELPYLQTLGYPWRAAGPEEVQKFLENILSLFADFKFHDTKIFMDQADQVFGEYEVTTTVKQTGKIMHQLYMGRLVGGKWKNKIVAGGVGYDGYRVGVFWFGVRIGLGAAFGCSDSAKYGPGGGLLRM